MCGHSSRFRLERNPETVIRKPVSPPGIVLSRYAYLVAIMHRFHQDDVSTFESICRRILPLWNLDFRITWRPLFKQPFIGYYILHNED